MSKQRSKLLEHCAGIQVGLGVSGEHVAVILGFFDREGKKIDFVPYTSEQARKFAENIIELCDKIDSGTWKQAIADDEKFSDPVHASDL